MSRTLITIAVVLVVLYVLLSTRKALAPTATGVAHLPNPYAPPTTGTPPIGAPNAPPANPVMQEPFPGAGYTVPVFGVTDSTPPPVSPGPTGTVAVLAEPFPGAGYTVPVYDATIRRYA